MMWDQACTAKNTATHTKQPTVLYEELFRKKGRIYYVLHNSSKECYVAI